VDEMRFRGGTECRIDEEIWSGAGRSSQMVKAVNTKVRRPDGAILNNNIDLPIELILKSVASLQYNFKI